MMLHAEIPEVRELLLKGQFGLEKESLRIDENGNMAHTPDPFPEDEHIVRDFCENQTEINTSVLKSAKEAVESLESHYVRIQKILAELPDREYLWPFSNPPYIRDEDDVPVAKFEGEDASKTEYRYYLADRYGRYKMAFSGIHVNFSFDEELLKRNFKYSGETDYKTYKNQLYVMLAKKMAVYGWILTAVTAASPLLDTSFVEKGREGGEVFNGMASVRCSETGYWNYFTPLLDYTDLQSYTDRMQYYVDEELLAFPTELYYPIRLKPRGKNDLNKLREDGVSHIELRMFDLNPLVPVGVDWRDVEFAHLLMVWLASTPDIKVTRKDQVQAVQNFKNAAHYDLKTVKIMIPGGEVHTVAHTAKDVISEMKEFYQDYPEEVHEILNFEYEKFVDAKNRYAWKVREEYSGEYVKKGMELAKKRAEEAIMKG